MNETAQQRQQRINQEAAHWHSVLLSDTASEENFMRFSQWMDADSEHQRAYNGILTLWQQLPAPLETDKLRRQQNKRRRNQQRKMLATWAMAASLLLIAIGSFFNDYLHNPWADYRTSIGQQQAVTLADGSTLRLNTDTALNVALQTAERQIDLLRGEAEFVVAHDASRPFRVSVGALVVEALGTRFLVRRQGNQGVVSLLEGSVKVSLPSPAGAGDLVKVLKPGQQLHFDPQQLSQPESLDLHAADAWTRGKLIMSFVPLSQVVDEINRYQRSKIILVDSSLASREINIAVDIHKIDDWLHALELTLPVKVISLGPYTLIKS